MHPFLFQVGHFRFPAYGFFSLLALALCIVLIRRYARVEGLDPAKTTEAIVLTIAVGYFGARAFEVALAWRKYAANPKLVLHTSGVFLAGVIAAIVFGAFWLRRVGLPWLKGLDIFAMTAAAVEAVGRVGCFCSGCCWGTPTDLPWAVTFPDLARRLHAGLPAVPLHPTQLYMSLVGWTLLAILAILYRRKRFDGQIITSFVVLYGIARFFAEFVRGDAERGFLFGGRLSTSQFLSLVLGVAAAAGFVHLARRARAQVSAA